MRPASPVLLAPLALLAACSSQQDKELAAVKSAHSVTAEWAMIERLAAERKTTQVYTGEMRDKAREELKSERKLLRGPAAEAVDAAQLAPSPASLADAAARLDQAEKQLEAH
jgi:hypothetical protein